MIYEGLLDEGLNIVKAVRDRYDGRRRNPWDEVECGHHYARAMSSWGVLLALAGYSYSGPDMRMGFDPKVQAADFQTVWTAGSGWGTYAQKIADGRTAALKLDVASGGLTLKEFDFTGLAVPPKGKLLSVKGTLGSAPTKPVLRREGNVVRVLWPMPITVNPGAPLSLEVGF
jgi:hypothetical protein